MNAGKYLWRPIDLIGCLILGPLFVGGENVEEVLAAGSRLKKEGYRVTYNLLGEHAKSSKTVLKAVETTTQLIDKMDDSNRGSVVIKPTLYGLQISKETFYEAAERILACAMRKGVEDYYKEDYYKKT